MQITIVSFFFFLLTFCSGELQASSITVKIIEANQMNNQQWQEVNNLWSVSFYIAYKDFPLDQLDADIHDASEEALLNFLQSAFERYHLLALKDSYSLALAYNDEKLVGYTLYHLLDRQPIIHIDHFAVDPNCQGKGIGKLLLESTIDSTPGIMAVVLTTRILNKAAQAFYRRQGFYQITGIDNLIFDSRYSILLRKDIEN